MLLPTRTFIRNTVRISIPVLLLLAACADRPAQAPTPNGPPVTQPGPPQAAEIEPDPALVAALDRAVLGEWQDLRLTCECADESGSRSVLLFGSGVGVWGNQVQFNVERSTLQSVLETVRSSGFLAMRDSYGGKNDPIVPGEFATRVGCWMNLSLDGLSKQVAQLEGGRQYQPFKDLAGKILDQCEGPAGQGVTVESLEDGLSRIAEGSLDPQVLSLIVNFRPDERAQQAGTKGWLMRLEAGLASLEVSAPGIIPDPIAVRLRPESIQSLAAFLAERDIEGLPVNLYAEHYTDVVIELLKYRKNIQARQFANMTPETHGQSQVIFDEVMDRLDQFREEILAAR